MIQYSIYFSDLNEQAQAELLILLGCKDAAEMNWDMDIIPLATLDFEFEEFDCNSEDDSEKAG